MKADIICDKCSNYEISLDGCSVRCYEKLKNKYDVSEYFDKRMNGESFSCKFFRKLQNYYKEK